MRAQPGCVIEDKRRHGHTERNLRGGCWRNKAGDQPQDIHEENKQEDRAEERHVFSATVPHDLFRRSMHELINEFKRMLDFSWFIYRQAALQEAEENQDEQND